LWAFAYFSMLASELEVEVPLMISYLLITWKPWAPLGGDTRFQFAGGWAASRYRILFEGPATPPDDMRSTEGLTPQDVNSAILGTDVFLHLEEGEYATYRHTYLMPPLTAGDSHTIRGYGNTVAREWYTELPDAVRRIVDQAGFGSFCRGLSQLTTCRPLLAALAERWWDTTDSFHFSAAGDMTMTPYDFSMLTGIGYRGTMLETIEEIEQYARGFLMFLLGTTLFSDRRNTVGLYLLSALVDLSQVSQYDWGGAGLATLYCYMIATSRGRGNIVGGYWRAWELWVCAYFPTLAPELEVEAPLEIPYSSRFKGRCRPRAQETLPYLRQFFETVQATEPWASLGGDIRFQFPGAWASSLYRILLEGLVGRAWFLGDRFMRQTMGVPDQGIPSAPQEDMRSTEGLTPEEVDVAMLGTNVVLLLEEEEYATYRHTYLMPPLTGIRTPMRWAAGASPSSRARAADMPSTSRADTSRGEAGHIPPITSTYQHAGWPDLPTKLTGWRYGTSYPIPLEPPLPDHRYVRDPDSPLSGGLTREHGPAEGDAAVHRRCS
ncbi:Protein MAIN-LIKE 2, partial [Camellia lanceoleosa]